YVSHTRRPYGVSRSSGRMSASASIQAEMDASREASFSCCCLASISKKLLTSDDQDHDRPPKPSSAALRLLRAPEIFVTAPYRWDMPCFARCLRSSSLRFREEEWQYAVLPATPAWQHSPFLQSGDSPTWIPVC